MDAVIDAQHAFQHAVDGLSSSNVEEERAKILLHDASAAVDVFSAAGKNFEGYGKEVGVPSREGLKKELLMWVQAVQVAWKRVVEGHCGVRVAKHLDLRVPSLCGTWLDALRGLGSCAVFARDVFPRRRGSKELETESFGSVFDELVEGQVLEDWIGDDFLSAVWPELKDSGGLRSSRWRARVSAVELVSTLAGYDIGVDFNINRLPVLEELLQSLVFRVGLGDSQWQVRRAVVPAVTRLLMASQGFLSETSWASLTWGVLAICVDPQPEVRTVATDAINQNLLPTSSSQRKVVVQGLLDRFINAAIGNVEAPERDFNSLNEDKALLDAVHAAVLLELVPHQVAFEAEELGNISIDRVPLLMVAASVAFSDSEKMGNNVLVASLTKLLRSLGSYQASLLAMLKSTMPLYECDNLARYCKRRGVFNEATALKMEKVPTATTLKGLATAFEALDSPVDYPSTVTGKNRDNYQGDMQLDALQHISEMLHVPPQLTRNYKEKATEGEIRNYLECGNLYLRIALVLVTKRKWTAQQAWEREDFVYNLFLSFAALASGIIESEKAWVDSTGLGKLCNDAVVYLSEAVQRKSCSVQDGNTLRSDGDGSEMTSMESLVLRLLPATLTKFKAVLKVGTRHVSEEKEWESSTDDDLPAAIISAHQLRWCLHEVQYPHFKTHSEMAIRTVLTALDHYSPPIKRQAMRAFIHLARNVSATELCWFKDAILDAVNRSLIGCEDLWPVAVKMAVALVTRIEGGNPRGQWYGAIMKEMLEELERHRSDQGRIVVWLQNITPQFESMGVFLVAHFKHLLPLLYEWLHARDEATQLLVLANLGTVIKYTWPRIPFHASRIQEELTRAQKDAEDRNSSPKLFAAINDVRRLLQLYMPLTQSLVQAIKR